MLQINKLTLTIGLAQIEKLKKIIKLKKNIHILYKKMFSRLRD